MIGSRLDQLGLSLLGATSDGYERLIAFSALAWALALSLPGERPAIPALPPPAWPWALAGFAIGLAHLVGLVAGRLRLRLLAAWAAMPFWWAMFGLCLGELPGIFGPTLFLVHALFSSWACILLTGRRYGRVR
jgi:hypothetical protein